MPLQLPARQALTAPLHLPALTDGVFALTAVVWVVAAVALAYAAFAPPDPVTQPLWFRPSLLVAVPVSHYAFCRA